MKKLVLLAIMLACVVPLNAQNWTTVSATNITDLNQQKLATGQLCFLGTDQNDVPISFNAGGGGQVLKRAFCSTVSNGIAASFTVPNPAGTTPTGIYYRITVKDVNSGQEVLRYTQVSFSGATFNFDTYAPTNLGQFAPLTGTAVAGNLSVNGNFAATGTVTASNIPTNILQQVSNSGTGLTQRITLNMTAGLQCADNAGASRTDCRLGTFTTLVFSATPIFDASTASTFKLTLTGNVTSSTLSGAVAGEPLAFLICQDAIGGRAFVPPANLLGWVTIPTSANACVLETFVYDGTNAQADGDTAGQVLAQDGTQAAPSMAFENETNTGLTRNAAGDVIYSILGAGFFRMLNSGATFTLKSGNGYCVASTGVSSPDTCLWRTSAGIYAVGSATAGSSSAELDARTVGITGSTSGATKLVTDAAASGTATVKAGTYNLVGDSLTQTLTNKTIDTAGPNTIKINGNTLSATAGTATVTIPNSTDTLVGRATTDTLTNKTIGAGGLAGLTPTFQQFTSSGTFTIPTGVTGVKVTVVGGGGAGGGGGSSASSAGCGGNSGGTSIKWLSGLTPGNTLVVTIGAGGTGNSNASGGSGGNSTVASGTQAISTITGSGGVGGTGPGGVGNNPTPGSGGDLNFAGNAGTLAPVSSAIAGNGGGSIFGGGGLGGFSSANGNAGTAPGAGGGGGGANNGVNTTGGAGVAGIVIFEWAK